MPAIVVVQARAASTRLPGKALKPLAGVPMLAFLLRRLLAGGLDAPCCLATTTRPEDDALAALAASLSVPVVRGECEDVLARYLRCLDCFAPDGAVRVTADNPFTSLEMLRLALASLAQGADYVALPQGCPHGAGVDAFSAGALRRVADAAPDPAEREHINLRMLRQPGAFAIRTPSIPTAWRRPDVRLTVDTPDDYAAALRLAGGSRPEELLDFDDILARIPRPAA
ncbi:MAG: hypothetical protein LBU75_12135 [Desulfovibrio sp.]|jgi:spore coat polysaccharide biosynthesis protein SpsF|nr:hypothetical protein [Desulfovibrio sp.]